MFTLLPPDNATGNFTKIVQRLPVRIRVPKDVAKQNLLRAGMSVYTTVDTREGAADADSEADLDAPGDGSTAVIFLGAGPEPGARSELIMADATTASPSMMNAAAAVRAHPAAAAVCVSHHGVRDVHVDPGHPGRLGVAAEIQAGLSASSSEVSWVQTSYLIAEVIAIPLSGFLSRAFGTRLLFAISASGFTIASFFCGFASTIEQMILWRAIQGFLGAGMIPTVFASAYTVFPRSKFHIVGPIIGLVATLAPTIGPTVGGFITDLMSWHWLFFINIVPGIGITIGVLALVDFDQPNFALLEHFDWWGLLFMAGFLGTLEYVLEEGPQYAMAGGHLGRDLRGDLRGLGDRLLLARAQRAGSRSSTSGPSPTAISASAA